MIKVIFLDIDGVLNSTKSCEFYEKKYGGNGYGGFFTEDREPTLREVLWDEDCVRWLHKIVLETGASIVITSTWRHFYAIELFHAMFKLYQVFDLNIMGKTSSIGLKNRGEEIQKFIDQYSIINYVILDDSNNILPGQQARFVKTDFNVGLTEKDYLKAVRILGKEFC
ncbi:MAG: hypothetical protein H6584_02545 [Flavobacteriales bacterium]|nr:hypothetical protein [Flavobacteriales bacterium]